MGRQHTIYLSDATWNQLESLMGKTETMSATIRRCIQASYDNLKQFDRIKSLERLITLLNEDED
tara:strand:- start:274 stop:465 length:192 start_codon:yes stop_codon:yes gene_type:complete